MKHTFILSVLLTFTLPVFSYDQAKLDQLIIEFKYLDLSLIETEKDHFTRLLNEFLTQPENCYILVDKFHSIPATQGPAEEVLLKDYPYPFLLSRETHSLDAFVIPYLETMLKAAQKEGITIQVSSCYRSYEYQKNLYNYWVEKDGQKAADLYSAKPGTSQHQLGTTIDFGSIDDSFANTDAGKWLFTHAPEYGFSLSYPENGLKITGYQYESWHYRFIGKAGTELQQRYFHNSQQRLLEFTHQLLNE